MSIDVVTQEQQPKLSVKKQPRVTKATRLTEAATQQPGADNYRCQQCGLCNVAYGRFVQPPMQHTSRILVVHGWPYEAGATEGGFSQGYYGYILKHLIFKKINIQPSQIVFTGVVRCLVSYKANGSVSLKVSQVDMCSAFLLQEIKKLQPTHIIGFGAMAIRALYADKKQTLRPLLRKIQHTVVDGVSIPTLFTYSPGMVLDGEDLGTLDIMRNQIKDFLAGNMQPKEFLTLTEVP